MMLPRVTSRTRPFSKLTGLPVTAESAAANPALVRWRMVTTDLATGKETIVRPVNAPEEEVSQKDVK